MVKVRQVASPDSPGWTVTGTPDQSVTVNGSDGIFMRLLLDFLAMRSGCVAASNRPMIPPEDSPTQCIFDNDKPSSTARICAPIVSGV